MKLQYIEFLDHFSDGDQWTALGEYAEKKYEPLVCRSVGWVVREDKHQITLLANLDGSPWTTEDRNGFGAFVILKPCVVRRVTMTPYAKKGA